MLKTTVAGRAVRLPIFRLDRSMRDAALLVGGIFRRVRPLKRLIDQPVGRD